VKYAFDQMLNLLKLASPSRRQLEQTNQQRRLEQTIQQLEQTKQQLRRTRKKLKELRGGWSPANLRKLGLSPRTVVDVGAGDGTRTLYEAFPEAFQVLIEPLKENEPHLQRILQEYEGEYYLTAVGDREEELTINVEPNVRKKSSIHSRTNLTSTGDLVERREIPVTTLDTLMKKHNFQPPFGLKIDTEGFEYQVVEGATDFLRETQFVIAEVSVAKRFTESYSFSEFIEIMDRNGFSLYDILNMRRTRSPLSKLLFVDAMFTKAERH
jgi:FkbM family methyltransferase